MATVIRKINADKFMNILQEADTDLFEACSIVESEEDGSKSVVLTIDEENEIGCVFCFGDDIISAVIALEIEPNYELVNAFNRESVFVTAVVDEDDSTVLRSVLTLEGGMTTEHLVVFVKLMIDSLNTFGEIAG